MNFLLKLYSDNLKYYCDSPNNMAIDNNYKHQPGLLRK